MPASVQGQNSCSHWISGSGHVYLLLDDGVCFGVQCVRDSEAFTCWGVLPKYHISNSGLCLLKLQLLFLCRENPFFSRIWSPVAPCKSDYILIRNAERIIEVVMEELFCQGNTDGISHLYVGYFPFSADVIRPDQRTLVLRLPRALRCLGTDGDLQRNLTSF